MLLRRMPQFGSLILARTAIAMVILSSVKLLSAEILSVPLRRYGILWHLKCVSKVSKELGVCSFWVFFCDIYPSLCLDAL